MEPGVTRGTFLAMRILVTGASGFVGSRLLESLREAGHEAIGSVRREFSGFDPEIHRLAPDESSLEALLADREALVHAAGVAHRRGSDAAACFSGNRDLTTRLALGAKRAGIRVMVHLSSIAAREAERGLTLRAPVYGRSKLEAEPSVERLGRLGKLGVNLRPPLIYGPGAPGNWERLVRLARSPLPLPFAGVRNRRSYLYIGHLAEAVRRILEHADDPELSGTYEIGEAETPSLADVVAAIRRGWGREPGLFPFPAACLAGALRVLGKGAMAEGLFGDLFVDAARFSEAFAWRPGSPTLAAMERSVA